MKKKRGFLRKIMGFLVTAFLSVCLTGCFSPVYDTARTYTGLTVGGWVAYHDMNYTSGTPDFTAKGVRPDFCVGFAPVNWFSVVGHAGFLISADTSDGQAYPFAGAGVKFSTPWDVFNMGIRIEAEFPRIGSITPMIGFSIPKRWEIVTLGISTSYLIIPASAFINIHPFKGAHLFAGVSLPDNDDAPEVCLGIGYTYTFEFSSE